MTRHHKQFWSEWIERVFSFIFFAYHYFDKTRAIESNQYQLVVIKPDSLQTY